MRNLHLYIKLYFLPPISNTKLDLVITGISSTLATDLMQSELISNHFAVSFTISIFTLSLDTKTVMCRKLNWIDNQILIEIFNLSLISETLQLMQQWNIYWMSTPQHY